MLHVYSFMKHFPFGRKKILFPNLLDVNQRVLSLAKENMLERRDRNKVIFFLQGSASLGKFVCPKLAKKFPPGQYFDAVELPGALISAYEDKALEFTLLP